MKKQKSFSFPEDEKEIFEMYLQVVKNNQVNLRKTVEQSKVAKHKLKKVVQNLKAALEGAKKYTAPVKKTGRLKHT